MTNVITAEEIEQTIQQKNLSNWFERRCSICKSEYGYLFEDGRVFFNSSCGCAFSPPRRSSHQEIADYINMQHNEDVIDGLFSFWKPKDEMSDERFSDTTHPAYNGKIYNNVSDIELSGNYIEDIDKLLGIISTFRRTQKQQSEKDR